MGKNVGLTKEALEQAITAGKTLDDLVRDLGCTKTAVYKAIQRHGLGQLAGVRQAYDLTKEALEQAITAGKKPVDIALEVGCSKNVIYSRLRKYGIGVHRNVVRCGSSSDLVGQRFGLLQVLEHVGESGCRARYRCQCDCGKETVVRRNRLESNYTSSCGCLRLRTGPASPIFRGCGELPGEYWSRLRSGARTRGIPFCIEIEEAWQLFLVQGRLCALTGLSIGFGRNKVHTASLDRIDSDKGYEPGNVQWVHKDVNFMKMDLPHSRFVELCHLVAKKSTQ